MGFGTKTIASTLCLFLGIGGGAIAAPNSPSSRPPSSKPPPYKPPPKHRFFADASFSFAHLSSSTSQFHSWGEILDVSAGPVLDNFSFIGEKGFLKMRLGTAIARFRKEGGGDALSNLNASAYYVGLSSNALKWPKSSKDSLRHGATLLTSFELGFANGENVWRRITSQERAATGPSTTPEDTGAIVIRGEEVRMFHGEGNPYVGFGLAWCQDIAPLTSLWAGFHYRDFGVLDREGSIGGGSVRMRTIGLEAGLMVRF